MALSFPTSPSIGQIWLDPSNGFTYKWDGSQWDAMPFPISGLPDLSGIPQEEGFDEIWNRTSNKIYPYNSNDHLVIGGTYTAPSISLDPNGTITGPTNSTGITAYQLYLDGSCTFNVNSTRAAFNIKQAGSGSLFEVWSSVNLSTPILKVSGGTSPFVTVTSKSSEGAFVVKQQGTGDLFQLWSPSIPTYPPIRVENDGTFRVSEKIVIEGDLNIEGNLILGNNYNLMKSFSTLTLYIKKNGVVEPANPLEGDPFIDMNSLIQWVRNNVICTTLNIRIDDGVYQFTQTFQTRWPVYIQKTNIIAENLATLEYNVTSGQSPIVIFTIVEFTNIKIVNKNPSQGQSLIGFTDGSSSLLICNNLSLISGPVPPSYIALNISTARTDKTGIAKDRGGLYVEGRVYVTNDLIISTGPCVIKNDYMDPYSTLTFFGGSLAFRSTFILEMVGTNKKIFVYSVNDLPALSSGKYSPGTIIQFELSGDTYYTDPRTKIRTSWGTSPIGNVIFPLTYLSPPFVVLGEQEPGMYISNVTTTGFRLNGTTGFGQWQATGK